MKVKIITLFPQVFPGVLGIGVIGRALRNNLWQLEVIDLKKFSIKGRVDDSPYGGGPGMIMSPIILGKCIDSILKDKEKYHIIYMSAKGQTLNNQIAKEISIKTNLIIICGRYEGIDERVIKHYNIQEISIGNYVLSGGEVASMTFLEAVIRHIPTVIKKESLEQESFSNGYLEHPQYTRPYRWRNKVVPKVLISGHHENIEKWKKRKSIKLIEK